MRDPWANLKDSFDAEYERERLEGGRPCATEGEADAEYARNVGAMRPEQPWILSDRDVWYANHAYHGPRVPHPEEEADDAMREAQGDERIEAPTEVRVTPDLDFPF
jgi:hypothetical protein